ncbi:MAG: hypothetical protein RXN89_04105 [Vulcanisaeta sp.]|jgi:hypothetical protein|nr:MAG: hypothetical protein AT714_01290 [Vulcanisaeta sp. OSP_8]KUO81694.1 MAG: hypothetical protein AT718_03840 [Vulcanisaeta sp. JCHS_4]KUO84479.1 MAG: hypothetical protein AT716_02910 [Vulcanisaeta sp. MG_3]MCG2864939.1 hypothetical protein [Vulcanisaeta sp.]MCG2866586.1 hypothetical protein [Vulcanisaeta sp.]
MSVIQPKEVRTWKDELRDVLTKYVRDPFKDRIDEYLGFLDTLYDKWWNGDVKTREYYAYHMALLMAKSDKPNVIKAKLNSYYAYLVYRGYVSAYRLMKDKYVAGGESIYTWLRMYRKVIG